MYQTILGAVDLSDLSAVVFERALLLSKLCAAKLILLHVLSSEEEGYPIWATFPSEGFEPVLAEGYLEHLRDLEQQGLQHLKTYANQAQKEGIEAEVVQVPGSAGKIICDFARSRNVDLIMMGNRGRSGFSELLLGSQSNYVMHHAPCSIQVIRLSAPESLLGHESSKTSINLTQT